MWRKLNCWLLATLLLLCAPLTVAAADVTGGENEIMPLMDYTSYYTTSIVLENGEATCAADLTGYPDLCTRIEITMTLQKKTLFWWSKVETWSTAVDDYTAMMCETASVGSGTYRVKAEFVVYSGTATEELTGYSQEDSI